MRIHHATVAKAKKFQITLTVEDNEVVATSKTGVRLASGLQGNKVLEDAITKLTGHAAKSKGNTILNSNKLPKELVKKIAKRAQELEEEDEESNDEAVESDADQSKSIVKAKYKQLYKPHKDRSGDDLSHTVNKHVSRENEAGEMQVDKAALRAFAVANDCWIPAYGSLVSRTGGWNSGMAVMNVNNRLRAKIRQAKKAGSEFKIKWV